MEESILLCSSTIDPKMLASCSQIIAAFFPGKKFRTCRNFMAGELSSDVLPDDMPSAAVRSDAGIMRSAADNERSDAEGFCMNIESVNTASEKVYEICLTDRTTGKKYAKTVQTGSADDFYRLKLPGKEPLSQIILKRGLCTFLSEYTGKKLPWGSLTGIRPGKIIGKMTDLGYDEEQKNKVLRELYLVDQEKVSLLHQLEQVQQPFRQTMKEAEHFAGVYLAIPFCPSRCFYCSFPSNTLTGKQTGQLCRYLEALKKEVKLTGEMMRGLGMKADSLYIGGGTPTVLSAADLQMLLETIRDEIPQAERCEYSVEAGRPDTIDHTRLTVMKNFGVNRISVNPQTMQEATLPVIGRRHTAADIRECFLLARDVSDWVINMDLILGLPGEGSEEVLDSVEKVLALQPDNITVHALALKRGSAAWENHSASNREDAIDWQDIQREVHRRIQQRGYIPYYLYRQKYIAGNLENIGYALQGKECRYNIAVIEEQQNIMGLGAGSVSKIRKKDSGHENIYHPVDLQCYENQLMQVHQKIKQSLTDFLPVL
ncbi:putative radical SAM family enzyme, NOT coproporphyrinogen III oxidase, oxygen-independent [Dehalobacter sp. UNSWDHB]|jgi:Coproporphyrinogen III oxidase and related Fe-S oxidoreductases|uniref:coproporphyrinogen dehydrogenase HemZ n=1 Tax=unclassified Dehalobacter TaxID=2635733 RepID=UPI00028B2190|nr:MULTISPECIES: coproporphyrinogen dehydrogenase HemZ [unclassified Dehalobacter]AFV01867.1 putative radical SAM family enzyme, NOT coproporphyrinogen III oxidase, oxygen-independent [Dehalobacter sp. DCA]AFV04904.1 putative radical SAM family enzyme, NOT coproporphyrinogen III oxidase, oxygen-independent [Dehalobacter sp. CF]EQB20641.1 putative radical SAM family enzyme, NOT coproporphyrinogen III oxidase, oxygen-independent [Dehalobacter sp. UNSWDHB]